MTPWWVIIMHNSDSMNLVPEVRPEVMTFDESSCTAILKIIFSRRTAEKIIFGKKLLWHTPNLKCFEMLRNCITYFFSWWSMSWYKFPRRCPCIYSRFIMIIWWWGIMRRRQQFPTHLFWPKNRWNFRKLPFHLFFGQVMILSFFKCIK